MVFFPFAVLLVVFLFILQINEILDTVMQYKAEGEKAAMVPNLDTYVSRALSMAEDPQIRRTRKTLLIILGIFFALAVVGLFFGGFAAVSQSDRAGHGASSQIGQGITSALFYAFGLLVAYRYSVIGLRVFAWLHIVLLALAGIVFVGAILIFIFGASLLHAHKTESSDGNFSAAMLLSLSVPVIIFVLIAYAISLIIAVVIIKLSFKLARLIDANRNSSTQRV